MMAAEGIGLALSIYTSNIGFALNESSNLPICYAMIFLLIVVATPLKRNYKFSDSYYDLISGGRHALKKTKSSKTDARDVDLYMWKVHKVSREFGLTHREEEILYCLATGMKRAEIEEKFTLSENTVRTHMRHIYAKLDVHSYEQAVSIVENCQ